MADRDRHGLGSRRIPESQAELAVHEDAFINMLKTTRRAVGLATVQSISEGISKVVDLVTSIGGKANGIIADSAPVLREDDQVLEHRFQVYLPLGSARQHIEPFFTELGGRPVRQEEACYEMSLGLSSTLWQRRRGKQPSLEMRVDLSRVNVMSATPVEVSVHISTRRLEPAVAMDLLEKNGPAIFATIAQSRRGQLRQTDPRSPALALSAASSASRRPRSVGRIHRLPR